MSSRMMSKAPAGQGNMAVRSSFTVSTPSKMPNATAERPFRAIFVVQVIVAYVNRHLRTVQRAAGSRRADEERGLAQCGTAPLFQINQKIASPKNPSSNVQPTMDFALP